MRTCHVSRMPLAILLLASALFSADGFAAWQVERADSYEIVVDVSTHLRDEFSPSDFVGLNLNYFAFQKQLWDKNANATVGDTAAQLHQWLPSTRYRYPGGMVANGFSWQGSLGARSKRLNHKNMYGNDTSTPHFGLDEYLSFVNDVGGRHWYVLNLVGTDPMRPTAESSSQDVARSNQELSEWFKKRLGNANDTTYYQLGNELDRSKYEWPHNKYSDRARATMNAIQKVDGNARFVAFLRGFNYRYRKGNASGQSSAENLFADVLGALPDVEDYSLMQYYDGLRTDGKVRTVPFWLKKIDKTRKIYRKLRQGRAPGIWITEHARQASSNRPGADESRRVTSNQSAAVSTADYIIALTQMPEVRGAFWHGLNAGPWQLFDATASRRDLRPRPVFWALANFSRTSKAKGVLATTTKSANASNYGGGYDLRASAILQDGGNIAVWAANRLNRPVDSRLTITSFAGKTIPMTTRLTAGAPGVETEKEMDINGLRELKSSITFDKDGHGQISVPALCVCVFELEAR